MRTKVQHAVAHLWGKVATLGNNTMMKKKKFQKVVGPEDVADTFTANFLYWLTPENRTLISLPFFGEWLPEFRRVA